ncbi:MAG TPA: NACHT domain-containing protein [Archangium sp.]|nr:NACHT domain-containing protein [Archangium sp.]
MGELIKDLLDSGQFGDLATRFWSWLQTADWSSPRTWLGALFVCLLLGYYSFIWFPRKALEGFAALRDSWKKAGFRALTTEQDEFLRRRSQFCRALRSDLDTLNKSESWNDQFFTDLEADIETDAPFYASFLDKLRGRKSQGLRRVPSLMTAIESSTEPWLLLVGEPGSGKSVALRHFAHQLADEGIRSGNRKAKIPLYVNLKELPPPPPQGPNADWIRTFVIDNVRRGDADTAEYVKKNWEHHLREGIWFFLFDSFDEIPAVMHAPMGSTNIERYADAIRRFLASMNDCRGIIASREFKGPSSLPWHMLRIQQLSQDRQDELIENTFLQPDEKELVRRHLLASGSSLRHTPLFLTLLCRFVQREKRLPTSDHDLLWRHIRRLAERDQEYTLKRHGFSPSELLDGAMELAMLFASNPTLSLAPTHDQIAAALPVNRYTAEQLDHLLAALVDVKIGRNDVQEARSGDRRFTFSHRRYQETLFVRYLAKYPEYLSPRELLLDPRWREYTVALLQSEATNVISPLLEEASRLLAEVTEKQEPTPCLPGFGQGLGYYEWNGDAEVHLLGLLQEGLARRIEELPAALSVEIEKLLMTRWMKGDFHDRSMVLRLGGLLPQERLAEYLEFAVKKGSLEFQEMAFQKIVFLRKPPESLVEWVRERLSRQVLYARKRVELLRIEALCAHLPEAIGAEAIFRRCLALRRPLAPVASIARTWAWFAEPTPIINFFLPELSTRELFFENMLSASLVVLNAAGLAWALSAPLPAQNGLAITVSSWLPEVALVLLGIAYMRRTSVGRRADGGGKSKSWRLMLAVSIAVGFFLGVLLSPWVCIFLGLLNHSRWLTAVGCVLLVLLNIVPVSALVFSRARAWRIQRARLDAMRSQPHAPMPLAPQAQSLTELCTWLAVRKEDLIPDEQHARSLSRLVIHGLEMQAGSKVSEPPLLVNSVGGKWSIDDLRSIFTQIQGTTIVITPVSDTKLKL